MSPPPDADDHESDSAPRSSETGLEAHLPDATVDSRWWYWIAAVPVYVALSTLLGVLFFVAVFLGVILDAGVGIAFFAFAFVIVALLPGLLLAITFPLALYVDARAVQESGTDWDPDPALYGLVGLASVLMTAFTVSAVIALYYLYQRHTHVGTP